MPRGRLSMALLALVLLTGACASARISHVPAAGEPVVVKPPTRLTVQWFGKLNNPAPLETAPVEASRPAWDAQQGRVFVADRFGVVRALDRLGKTRWTRELGSAIEADLLLTDKSLFVATTGGQVVALAPTNGEVLWTYEAGVELATTPTLAGGLLLVPSLVDSVLALDAAKGTFRWFHRQPAPSGMTIRGAAGVTVVGERAFTAFSDGTVVALGLGDGSVAWKQRIRSKGSFDDVDTTPLVLGEAIWIGTQGGEVVSLAPATGEETSRFSVKHPISGLSTNGRFLLVLGPDVVSAIERPSGRLRWTTRLPGGAPSPGVLLDGTLLVGTSQGPLYGVSTGTGKPVVAFAPGSGVTAAPTPTSDGLWVWSNGGRLYRLVWTTP